MPPRLRLLIGQRVGRGAGRQASQIAHQFRNEKYPDVKPGTMTRRVLERGEIYKRRIFCIEDDQLPDGSCRVPQTLLIMEIRESQSPVIQGLHGHSSSLDGFLRTMSRGKWAGEFERFLSALKSYDRGV